MKIEFEKNTKTKIIRNTSYQLQDIFLMVNGQYFDTDVANETNRQIQSDIHHTYWDAISQLFFDDHHMFIKISGLHFDISKIQRKSCVNMVLQYRRWACDNAGTYDDNSYALIQCDRKLFKKFFDIYWFALGCEISFQGIVVEPDKLMEIEKWDRKREGKNKYNNLLQIACLVFNNLENGFHFRVTSNGCPEIVKKIANWTM